MDWIWIVLIVIAVVLSFPIWIAPVVLAFALLFATLAYVGAMLAVSAAFVGVVIAAPFVWAWRAALWVVRRGWRNGDLHRPRRYVEVKRYAKSWRHDQEAG